MIKQFKYVSLKTLLQERNIDHREFFICIKAISNEIPDLFKEKAEKSDIIINQNISKVCDELLLPPEVRRIAFKISEKFSGKLGFKSRIIAASAVSVAVRIVLMENSVSVLQISECLEITASTVYSHLKSIKIDVLKRKYQEFLENLINPIHIVVPNEIIQEKIKKLNLEDLLAEPKPKGSIKTEFPIPIITNKTNSDKIKRYRTSKFITKNKEIFSKFVPNLIQLGSSGFPIKESKFFGIHKNLGLSNGFACFTEFDFSPPIS